jgi:hypothetical protein
LIFLIVLIVATAVLLAWLLFAIARLGLGDLHVPRVHISLMRGSASASEATAGPGAVGRERRTAREREPERSLYDQADAERAVRERLYGRRSR